MLRIFFFCFFIYTTTYTYAQDTTRVLFIGNSLTYYNSMPQTFEDIARSKGDTCIVSVYAPGGTGFLNHVNDPNVYTHFRQGNWDYVILQPGSNESPGYSEPIHQTLTRARKLKDSILHYSPCAKILYYEISYGVWGNSSSDLQSYNNTMDLIRANLTYLADSTQLFFAPAGEAMRTAWNRDTSTMLWGSTGDIHPNAKGSYLIACTFYTSIFQKPSFGTSITAGLGQNEAMAYQHLADSTVLDSLTEWRINTYLPYTDFTYTTNISEVDFTNKSLNIDSVKWDFGEGSVSTQLHPTHTYTQNGEYDVTLQTYSSVCTESISKRISIVALGLEDKISQAKTDVYPNPFSDKISIAGQYKIEDISLYNTWGQDLTHMTIKKITSSGCEISTELLPNGTYILKTENYYHTIVKI